MPFKTQVSKLNQYPTPTSFKFWGLNQNQSVGTALDMCFTALNASGSLIATASATNGLLPSATAATYGTAFNVTPPSGSSNYTIGTSTPAAKFQTVSVTGIVPLEATFVLAAYDSGTVTMQITATYNDATTVAVNSKTATANGTTTYAIADMASLFVTGKYITNLALQLKSSATSSAVTCTGTVYGFSQVCNVQFPAFV